MFYLKSVSSISIKIEKRRRNRSYFSDLKNSSLMKHIKYK